jgi:hypothetical protein
VSSNLTLTAIIFATVYEKISDLSGEIGRSGVQEEWRRVEEVYQEALEHRQESRTAFVTAAYSGDSSYGGKSNRWWLRTVPPIRKLHQINPESASRLERRSFRRSAVRCAFIGTNLVRHGTAPLSESRVFRPQHADPHHFRR